MTAWAALDELYQVMEDAVASGDTAGFARANRAFHFVAFQRSNMKWMLRFLNMVWDAAAR